MITHGANESVYRSLPLCAVNGFSRFDYDEQWAGMADSKFLIRPSLFNQIGMGNSNSGQILKLCRSLTI